MSRQRSSYDSIREATDNDTQVSGHGTARGVGGFRDSGDLLHGSHDFLSEAGASKTLSIAEGHFDVMDIHLSWNNVVVESRGFLGRLLGRITKTGVDLDLACLYELKDGTRGCLQGFGNLFGAIDQPPYIHHTGDERTGNKPGADESMQIKGVYWENIKRIMVYTYVYNGPTRWALIKPEMRVEIPGQNPMIITPAVARDNLPIVALATIENLDGGVRLTNHSEYFSSQPAMDRAFGYGLAWEDGTK
ncbi:MAG TPA: Tellurium resistance protein TerA [Alphaproteobacteria bacterium]